MDWTGTHRVQQRECGFLAWLSPGLFTGRISSELCSPFTSILQDLILTRILEVHGKRSKRRVKRVEWEGRCRSGGKHKARQSWAIHHEQVQSTRRAGRSRDLEQHGIKRQSSLVENRWSRHCRRGRGDWVTKQGRVQSTRGTYLSGGGGGARTRRNQKDQSED